MKKIFFSITAIILVALVAARYSEVSGRTYMDIMTKDSVWYQMRFDEGAEILHNQSPENDFNVTFSDWIFGQTCLPIEDIVKMEIKNVEIPIIRLSLDDYPEAKNLWEKDLYLNAKIHIEGNGFVEDSDTLTLSLKGRGNSTWRMPKKPMRIKFSKKTSLAGLKKSKSYVLLNNMIDPTMMRNAAAMWLARALEVPYANEIIPCHLFLNDNYLGAYTLTHKVGLNSGSIHDIDEETGILFELSSEMDEKYCFYSKTANIPVMVKDPDFDELYEDQIESDSTAMTPETRLSLWQDDFNKAERSAVIERSAEAFDIESFVNYILLYDITRNAEISSNKSIFIHKENLEEGSKYRFGPAWDFDICFNSAFPTGANSYVNINPDMPLKLPRLFDSLRKIPEVDSCYLDRFRYFEKNIYSAFLDYIDSYSSIIETSSEIDGKRWPDEGAMGDWGYIVCSSGHSRHVKELREWIIERVNYLHSKYLPDEPFPEYKKDDDDNGDDDNGDDDNGDDDNPDPLPEPNPQPDPDPVPDPQPDPDPVPDPQPDPDPLPDPQPDPDPVPDPQPEADLTY